MLGRLILLIALVGAVLWFLRWFRRTPPERVAKVLRRSLLWGAVGVLVLLAVSGRLHPLFAALPAAVPVVIRVLNLLRLLPMIRQAMHALGLSGRSETTPSAGGGTAGQTSSICTRFLEMTLDHTSGKMDGLVLEGPFQGCRLSALDLEQLVDLLILCRSEDDQSAAVLEAYLDRGRSGDWRERAGGPGTAPPANTVLTLEEALAILGLAQGASKHEILAAHRRLMQRFHPDRGGSDYLAAKINAAKRLLLDE